MCTPASEQQRCTAGSAVDATSKQIRLGTRRSSYVEQTVDGQVVAAVKVSIAVEQHECHGRMSSPLERVFAHVVTRQVRSDLGA